MEHECFGNFPLLTFFHMLAVKQVEKIHNYSFLEEFKEPYIVYHDTFFEVHAEDIFLVLDDDGEDVPYLLVYEVAFDNLAVL